MNPIDAAREAREAADYNRYSNIAKVLAKTGSRYTVQLTSGGVMEDVVTQGPMTFKESDWVTLERSAGDWVIVGRAGRRGGD